VLSLEVHVLAALPALAAAAAPAAEAIKSKKIEPTSLDWVGTILGFASLTFAGVVLIGMAGWMIYKALTASQALSTSWGPQQEPAFDSYAQADQRVHSKSWMFAFVGAAVFTVLAVGVYFGVTPEKDKAGESMDMSSFDKKNKPTEAVK
jgi:hypothetical protein